MLPGASRGGMGSHQGGACPRVVMMPGEGGDAGAGRGPAAGRRVRRTAEPSVTHQAAGTRAQHRCSRQTAVGQRGAAVIVKMQMSKIIGLAENF